MKTRIFVLLIFIFSQGSLTSQTFEKIIRTEHDDYCSEAIDIGSRYFYFYSKGDYNSGDWKNYIVELDPSGEILQRLKLPDYNGFYEGGISKAFIQNDSSLLCIRGLRDDSNGDNQLNLIEIKYNTNPIELVFDTIFGSPNVSEEIYDFQITADNKIIGTGRDTPEPQNAIVSIINLDDITYEVWKYNVPESHLASTIMDVPERNVYHVFMYWDNNKSILEINKTTMEIDSIHYYPEAFLPRNAVKGISDTSYFVVGKMHQGYPNPNLIPSFLEVGDNGQIYNIHEYEVHPDTNSYYTDKSFDHKFGKIYFGATYNFTQTPPFPYFPERRWIFINKLNADGSIIWQRFYKGEVNYMPYKVLATNDGGALIFSTKYDWRDSIPQQLDLHILKIDSTGWYAGLPVAIDEYSEMKQILVYPNPVKNDVNFALGLYSDIDLQIFNINGQCVLSRNLQHSQKVNLSELPAGLYIYVLTGNKGFVEKGKLIKE